MLYNNGSMESFYAIDELRLRGAEGGGSTGGNNKAARLARKEIFLRLVASGISLMECGKQLKTSPITLVRWLQEPGMMERLKGLNALVYQQMDAEITQKANATIERIQQASDEALDKVLELMHGADSEVVQMRCAFDVLDRNPETTKTHKVQSTKRVVHIDADLVNAVLGAEKEAGIIING